MRRKDEKIRSVRLLDLYDEIERYGDPMDSEIYELLQHVANINELLMNCMHKDLISEESEKIKSILDKLTR